MAPGFSAEEEKGGGGGEGMGGRVDINFLAPRFPTEPNSGPVRKESGAQIPETGPGRCPLVRGVINRPPNYRSLCPLHYTVITPPKLSPPHPPTPHHPLHPPSSLPPSSWYQSVSEDQGRPCGPPTGVRGLHGNYLKLPTGDLLALAPCRKLSTAVHSVCFEGGGRIL